MDNSSTDQLDVELKDEDCIDIFEDSIVNIRRNEIGDNDMKTDAEKLRKSVSILEEENPFRFPVSKTEEKSTSTLSLEANTNKSGQKHSLKFWDKWLKFFVLIGAGVSLSVLCLVLIEEESKNVKCSIILNNFEQLIYLIQDHESQINAYKLLFCTIETF